MAKSNDLKNEGSGGKTLLLAVLLALVVGVLLGPWILSLFTAILGVIIGIFGAAIGIFASVLASVITALVLLIPALILVGLGYALARATQQRGKSD